MKLSEIVDLRGVKVGLEAEEKEEVFEELVDLLMRSGGLKDRQGALEAIHVREALGSTGIGEGVAIPHGKSETVERLVAALGVSAEGIEFDSLDGEPAYAIFLLLAQADNPGPHIQALSCIAQLVRIPGFIRRLREAATPEEIMDMIHREEEE